MRNFFKNAKAKVQAKAIRAAVLIQAKRTAKPFARIVHTY